MDLNAFTFVENCLFFQCRKKEMEWKKDDNNEKFWFKQWLKTQSLIYDHK